MMILISKRYVFRLMCWSAGVVILAGLIWAVWPTIITSQQAFAPADGVPVVWIIDAGHGGEDGGAVSAGGVQESHINLAVALRLHGLMCFTGQRAELIRREDVSVCDEGLDTVRARKASDIRNRVATVNGMPGAVLVSIHQNSLPSSPVTHGAQVFWNGQQGGETLANLVQDSLNGAVNTEKAKQSRKIPDTIYLMKHVRVPAILVECGFLSNAAETVHLQEPSYQTKLATAIMAGCLRALAGEEMP